MLCRTSDPTRYGTTHPPSTWHGPTLSCVHSCVCTSAAPQVAGHCQLSRHCRHAAAANARQWIRLLLPHLPGRAHVWHHGQLPVGASAMPAKPAVSQHSAVLQRRWRPAPGVATARDAHPSVQPGNTGSTCCPPPPTPLTHCLHTASVAQIPPSCISQITGSGCPQLRTLNCRGCLELSGEGICGPQLVSLDLSSTAATGPALRTCWARQTQHAPHCTKELNAHTCCTIHLQVLLSVLAPI